MGLYQQTDYRKALRDILDEKKRVDGGINFASYAEVIGVQKTFVSKVLGGNAHLSDDQLYLTLNYLNFSEEDANYFRLLYDYARTGLHARKKTIMTDIRKIQEEKRQLKVHTTAQMQKPEVADGVGEYYLEPMNLLVHTYLGVPKYAENPLAIANELGLSSQELLKILENLKRMQIIDFAKSGGKVTVLKFALHLDVNSIYCKPYQQLFRVKSSEQIAKLSPEKRFVYSLTFSGSHEVKGRIQEMYLEFIKKAEKYLDSNDSLEEIYQINFDLFPWSNKK